MTWVLSTGELSRISKLLVDRDQASDDEALARRQKIAVALCCGDDVASSYTLQLAVLTAASIANRCFPGAVRAAISPHLAAAPLRLWPWRKLTFGDAIAEILGRGALAEAVEVQDERIDLRDAPATRDALRITFDGWIAKVGPMATVPRLAEREYFSAAGILAASLALSELFLSFAEISLEATRRTVGISLWRPDLDIGDPEALGMPIEYLPRELWVLGLGHLGNAYFGRWQHCLTRTRRRWNSPCSISIRSRGTISRPASFSRPISSTASRARRCMLGSKGAELPHPARRATI